MKKVNFLAILAISIGLTTLSTSCTSNDPSDEALTTTAQDEAQVSSISDDVITNVDNYSNLALSSSAATISASDMQKVGFNRNIDGVIITIDKSGDVYPKTITLDFGTAGVTGKRGNVFKGKIILVVSDHMDTKGSTRTYSFENFSVNDNVVKGNKTVSYNGENNGLKSWTVVVNDTIVKAANGGILVSNSTRIRTRTNDNGTPKIYFDDSYAIEGSATGINAKGVAYSVAITKPLVTVGVWPVFVEGVMVVTTEKRSVITDYGDGTRDYKATVTVNGVTKTINLRK
ncbi:MAG: hypothetical protein AUK44_02140 [Porphyromonadaceae bacterium CG2_30_38_12]|nr:MAG: hypothetical protein AUK44_02140 [Porphyromonadaceae bacterium CG2_30_38_12]